MAQVRRGHAQGQEGRDPRGRAERLLGRASRLLRRRPSRSSAARSSPSSPTARATRTSARSSPRSRPRSPRPSSCPATTPRSGPSPARRASSASRCRSWAATAGIRPSSRDRRRGARRLLLLEPLLGRRPEPGRPEVRQRLQGQVQRSCRTPWPRSATTRPRILADAMKRAGSTDGAKVRDAIAATKDFPGVTGQITIDEERNAVKPAVVAEGRGRQVPPDGDHQARGREVGRRAGADARCDPPHDHVSSSSSSTACRWGRSTP